MCSGVFTGCFAYAFPNHKQEQLQSLSAVSQRDIIRATWQVGVQGWGSLIIPFKPKKGTLIIPRLLLGQVGVQGSGLRTFSCLQGSRREDDSNYAQDHF